MLHKVLDLVWKKINLRIGNLRIKPLRSPFMIVEWITQFVIRLLYGDMLERWDAAQIENWVRELNTDELQKRHILSLLLQTKNKTA